MSERGEAPVSRLLVGQVQAAVARLSMRDDRGVDPLTAAFYLHERHARFEDGVHDGDHAVVESALADLFVASVWIADGYGVALKKAYQDLGEAPSLHKIVTERASRTPDWPLADELSAARSALAEVVANIGLYEVGYGGPESNAPPPLRDAIPRFHLALLDVGIRLGVDVLACLTRAFRLDTLTLSSGGHNPLYAKSVRQFGPVALRTYCPFAVTANLWGAPDHDPALSVPDNVRRSLGPLRRFTRAARREVLDGYLFAFPADPFGTDFKSLGRLLRTVLGTLAEQDPAGARELDRDEVLKPGWRFRYDGEDYFVPVFAPLYGQDHSRYTYEVSDTVFVLLQPDSSFHSRLDGDSARTRAQIRQRFGEGLQAYDLSGSPEAHRFLPPPAPGAPAPAWYDAPPIPR